MQVVINIITFFKLNPNSLRAEYEIYVPLHKNINKDQAIKSILSTLEAQIMMDLKDVKFMEMK